MDVFRQFFFSLLLYVALVQQIQSNCEKFYGEKTNQNIVDSIFNLIACKGNTPILCDIPLNARNSSIDLTFVVDTSGSVNESIPGTRKLMKNLVKLLRIKGRLAVAEGHDKITFIQVANDKETISFDHKNSICKFDGRVDSEIKTPSGAITARMDKAMKNINNTDTSMIVVMIFDGRFEKNGQTNHTEALEMKKATTDIKNELTHRLEAVGKRLDVLGVGVGSYMDQENFDWMNGFVSDPQYFGCLPQWNKQVEERLSPETFNEFKPSMDGDNYQPILHVEPNSKANCSVENEVAGCDVIKAEEEVCGCAKNHEYKPKQNKCVRCPGQLEKPAGYGSCPSHNGTVIVKTTCYYTIFCMELHWVYVIFALVGILALVLLCFAIKGCCLIHACILRKRAPNIPSKINSIPVHTTARIAEEDEYENENEAHPVIAPTSRGSYMNPPETVLYRSGYNDSHNDQSYSSQYAGGKVAGKPTVRPLEQGLIGWVDRLLEITKNTNISFMSVHTRDGSFARCKGFSLTHKTIQQLISLFSNNQTEIRMLKDVFTVDTSTKESWYMRLYGSNSSSRSGRRVICASWSEGVGYLVLGVTSERHVKQCDSEVKKLYWFIENASEPTTYSQAYFEKNYPAPDSSGYHEGCSYEHTIVPIERSEYDDVENFQ